MYLHLVDFYGFHVGKYTSPMFPMGLLVEWTKVSIPKLFFHAFLGGDLAGLLDHVSPKKMKLSFLWNVFAKAWMGPRKKGERGEGGFVQ